MSNATRRRTGVPQEPSSAVAFFDGPTTYHPRYPYRDDDNLYSNDISLLCQPLRRYVHSDQPGIATLFVYGVREDNIREFWGFVEELSSHAGMYFEKYQTHNSGNEDLATLLYSSIDIP